MNPTPTRNRLFNPTFASLNGAMPVSDPADSTLVETASGWFVESVADGGTPIALTVSQAPIPATQLAIPGEPENLLQVAITGAGANLGANSYLKLCTRLAPTVLNGLYAVLSVWINSAVANAPIVMRARRSYGTGGSPSPDDVFPIRYPLIRAVAGWQRFALSFPLLPINDGVHPRTLGTNGDAFVELALYLQAGLGLAIGPRGDGVVCPTNTLQFAQPQLEQGTTATPWVDGDPQAFDSTTLQRRSVSAPGGVLTTA